MPYWLQRAGTFVLKTLGLLLALFLLFKGVKYLAPFLVAFILSSALFPLVRWMERKLRIHRKIGSVFSILLALGTVGTLLGLMAARIATEIHNLYTTITSSSVDVSAFFRRVMDQATAFYIRLPQEVTNTIDSTLSALGDTVRDVIGSLAKYTLAFTVSVPEALVFVLITIIATYFMLSDRVRINEAIERWIPKRWLTGTRSMVLGVFKAMFGWLRAQGIIICITFTIIVTGLVIAGVQNPLVIALMTAIIDALPVFGAGFILIPWGVLSLIAGNVRFGVFLLLLDVVVLVVRHLIEPKIVGKQIGIHPLLTLMGMYLGLRWIGVLGMIVGPILMVLTKALLENLIKIPAVKALVDRWFREDVPAPPPGGVREDVPVPQSNDGGDTLRGAAVPAAETSGGTGSPASRHKDGLTGD
ncbi:MAG: sporulation integral membrane protein YtvI [Oscillospiraceae bacterium]|nr:sporulation integral membrane protein YtvI [Oscillospiraceae bacterium]